VCHLNKGYPQPHHSLPPVPARPSVSISPACSTAAPHGPSGAAVAPVPAATAVVVAAAEAARDRVPRRAAAPLIPPDGMPLPPPPVPRMRESPAVEGVR